MEKIENRIYKPTMYDGLLVQEILANGLLGLKRFRSPEYSRE